MGRRFTSCVAVVLVALGAAANSADAKDRKSAATRDREALADLIAAREQTAVLRQEASTSRAATSAEVSSPARNGKPIAPLEEQQPAKANPFRFNIGAVALQPAVGGIKGAQFSIGF